MKLSDKAKKAIEEARKRMKKGRFVTEDQMRERLELKPEYVKKPDKILKQTAHKSPK